MNVITVSGLPPVCKSGNVKLQHLEGEILRWFGQAT